MSAGATDTATAPDGSTAEEHLRDERELRLNKIQTAADVLQWIQWGQQAWSAFVLYGEEDGPGEEGKPAPRMAEMGRAFVNATSALMGVHQPGVMADAGGEPTRWVSTETPRASVSPVPRSCPRRDGEEEQRLVGWRAVRALIH